ncbi:MAG: M42 family metallopeptidase [bacterium]
MHLKQLSDLTGVAGYEHRIRKYIKEKLESKVTKIETDPLGNLICYKKGKKNNLRVLLAAHMDEVGFIINKINKNGFLGFTPSGGIDPRVLPAKRVLVGNKEIPGVIHWAPPHLKENSDQSLPKFSSLVIDIGASSDKQAKQKVKVGEFAVFDTKFSRFSKNIIKGKAFDDRVGCSLLMDLLEDKTNYSFELAVVFSVQEEVGLRGAAVLGEKIDPKFSLIVEGTAAADFPGEPDQDISTSPRLGGGPVITLTDRSTIVDRRLINALVETAKKNKIKYQFKQPNIGGTDAGRIHKSRAGIPSAILSVPARYIHSPVSLSYLSDYKDTYKLIKLSLVNMLKAIS